MATTLTLYISVWPVYYVVQVGDSRYYLWRDGRLTQLTRDQTIAQELVDQGILTRAQAPHTQFAHVLSSALGADTAEPVVTRLQSDWHNVHLLCSDGLTKHVSDEQIAERLRTMTSAKQVCERCCRTRSTAAGRTTSRSSSARRRGTTASSATIRVSRSMSRADTRATTIGALTSIERPIRRRTRRQRLSRRLYRT